MLQAVLVVLIMAGCSNPNDAFSGLWEPTGEVDGMTVIDGEPTLALGHYGREVAGIVYFTVPGGSQYRQPCPCAYVDHLRYDADEGTLDFESRCDGQPVAALWRLQLTEDPLDGDVVLTASVKRADGQPDEDVIEFRRIESFVGDTYKVCPPP